MSGPWEQYQQQPAVAPPPAAVGPWSQYQQAAPTQTPATAPSPDTGTSDPGLLQQYGSFVKQHATWQGVKDRLKGMNAGIGQTVDQLALPVERGVRNVTGTHMLDSQIAHDEANLASAKADDGSDQGGGQEIGRQTGQIAAFEGGGKVLDTVIEGLAGTMHGASMLQRIKELGPIAKALEKSPQSLAAVGRALRNATVGGGLEAAQGGDAGDVAKAAALQGAAGGVLDVLPSAAADMAERVKPGTAEIAGAKVPVMSKTAAGAEAALSPDVRAAQQSGGQEAIRNLAQKATADSLDRVNATRPQPVSDPARMLPAPEGEPRPYQFTMDTPEPDETPQTTPPGSRDIPGGDRSRLFTGDPLMAKSEWQYNPPESGQGSISNGRGATVTTSDPAAAHHALAQMDDLIGSPSFDQLSGLKQRQLQAAAEALRAQVGEEGAYRARMSHFAPINSAAAASKVGSFADAAAQIEGGVSDVYSKLDDVSDGKWGQLRKSEQQAVRMTRNATSPEAADSAEARLANIRKEMQGVFDANREQIHPAEWRAANTAWKDASTLKDIHATLERSFNGVPQDVADATGIDRTLKGGNKLNKGLQKLLEKRGDDVRGVIGQEGVNNLYRVSQLLSDPAAGSRAKGLLQAVGAVTRHHGIHLGAGALIGGGLGEIAGRIAHIPFAGYQGALAGVATEAAVRRALARAATNPAIAERLSYAAKNNVSHRVAAPLLAAMMLNPPQQQQPPDDPQPQP